MNKFFTIMTTLLLFIAMPSWGQSVVRDGKEWLQPVDFTNLSWDDVNAVCPAGVCAGTLNGVDVTGYNWASVDESSELFNSYGVTPPLPVPSTYSSVTEADSTWAPAFVVDFSPTVDVGTQQQVRGWTSSELNPTTGRYTLIADVLAVLGNDSASTPNTQPKGNGFASIGVWMWRTEPVPPTAEAVPTLSAYGLVLTVLGLFVIAARRLSRRKVTEG
ncbi:MAG: hypothetical protein ACI8QT_000008 [Halioglobus sp.]